jgi:O-antigen ligase
MNKALLFRNAYSILLVLIAFTLPTKWMQLNSILILCSLGVYLVEPGLKARLNMAFRDRHVLVFCSIYLLYVISLLWTENFSRGFSQLEIRFSLLVLPFLILSYTKIEKENFEQILTSFLVACLFFSLVCLVFTIYTNQINGVEYAYYNSWHYSSDSLVKEFGFHPSYFSIYCAFSIFIVIFFVKEKKIGPLVGIFLSLYLIGFQLLLAARGGVLATMAIVILTILYEAWLIKKILIGLVIIGGFTALLIFSVLQFDILTDKFKGMINYEIYEYNERFQLTMRFQKWESAWTLFTRNPVLGVGIGDSKEELLEVYLEKGYIDLHRFEYNAHNLVLDTAITIGIVGVLALIVVFYFSTRIAIRDRNILYMQFLFLFLSLSLVEATFSVQKGVVLFSFFNFLFIANSNARRKASVINIENPTR